MFAIALLPLLASLSYALPQAATGCVTVSTELIIPTTTDTYSTTDVTTVDATTASDEGTYTLVSYIPTTKIISTLTDTATICAGTGVYSNQPKSTVFTTYGAVVVSPAATSSSVAASAAVTSTLSTTKKTSSTTSSSTTLSSATSSSTKSSTSSTTKASTSTSSSPSTIKTSTITTEASTSTSTSTSKSSSWSSSKSTSTDWNHGPPPPKSYARRQDACTVTVNTFTTTFGEAYTFVGNGQTSTFTQYTAFTQATVTTSTTSGTAYAIVTAAPTTSTATCAGTTIMVTQDARCAPAALTSAYNGYGLEYASDVPATGATYTTTATDASDCCQQCSKTSNCAASSFDIRTNVCKLEFPIDVTSGSLNCGEGLLAYYDAGPNSPMAPGTGLFVAALCGNVQFGAAAPDDGT